MDKELLKQWKEQIWEEIEEETGQKPAYKEAKTAKKRGEKMVKNFTKEMFTQAGMRDEKGSLLTSGRFDFNEQLGKGSSFIKFKKWQVLKSYNEFKLDYLGLLILPKIDSLPLEMKKAIIQLFLTIHYTATGKYCRKLKVPVLWSDIMKGQLRFISSTYLPDDVKILESSKMQHVDANAILEFWWDQ
ncbi:hypothetical protein BDR04DRAFT_1120395 [Suillus decipiens]|nr:hypothetical protein BDR04DRAFT_1120395 [Suillus decipiens]